MEVKHGGCLECGTKDQEILTSRTRVGEACSGAYCKACEKSLKEKGVIL